MNLLNLLLMKKQNQTKELFKNYFSFEKPTVILKTLYNLNDKNKNKQLVDVIKSGLIHLKKRN